MTDTGDHHHVIPVCGDQGGWGRARVLRWGVDIDWCQVTRPGPCDHPWPLIGQGRPCWPVIGCR